MNYPFSTTMKVSYLVIFFIQHSFSLNCKGENLFQECVQNNIAKVVYNYFQNRGTLGVFVPHHFSISNIIANYLDIPVITYDQDFIAAGCSNLNLDFDGYIFIIKETLSKFEQITELLRCCSKSTLKMNTKRIIVICIRNTDLHSEEHSEILRYFHWIWLHFRVINLIFIMVSEVVSSCNETTLLAYNPFLTERPSDPGVIMRLLLSDNIRLILERRFYNLHGYPVKASMFPFSFGAHPLLIHNRESIQGGSDIVLRWMIERYFNLTFVTQRPRDNKEHGFVKDGVAFGALKDIIDNNVDYAVNSKFVKWYDSPVVQFVFPRLESGQVIIVAKRGKLKGWRIILNVFQPDVVMYFALSFFGCCGFAFYLMKIANLLWRNKNSERMSWFHLVLKSSFSVPLSRVPKSNYFRILISSCLCFGVVITNIFLAQIIHLTKENPQLRNINTLEDLFKTKMPIYSPFKSYLTSFDYLDDTTFGTLKYRPIYRKWNTSTGYPRKLSKRFALIMHSLLLKPYIMTDLKNKDKIHCLQDVVNKVFMGNMMNARSVYYEYLNIFVGRLFQYGFFGKWESEYLIFLQGQRMNATIDDNTTESRCKRKFNMNDLRLPFYIIIVGLSLSVLIFLLEILVNDYCKCVK